MTRLERLAVAVAILAVLAIAWVTSAHACAS